MYASEQSSNACRRTREFSKRCAYTHLCVHMIWGYVKTPIPSAAPPLASHRSVLCVCFRSRIRMSPLLVDLILSAACSILFYFSAPLRAVRLFLPSFLLCLPKLPPRPPPLVPRAPDQLPPLQFRCRRRRRSHRARSRPGRWRRELPSAPCRGWLRPSWRWPRCAR